MIDLLAATFDILKQGSPALAAYPLLLLLLLALPLAGLAYFTRTYPHAPLAWLLLVPCLMTLATLANEDLFPVVLAVDLAILLVALGDLASQPRARNFSVQRSAGRIASLRKNHRVSLTISNLSGREHRITVRDGLPQEFTASPPEVVLRLGGRSRASLHYDLQSSRRGAFQLSTIHLRVLSRAGLWKRYLTYPILTVIHVYPDMKQLAEYAVLARTNRLSLMGVRRTRKLGQDNEFERLRDYTRDDNFKHIDWRSTARRNKLTVKDFQTDQSQRIIFLVDCGRMMTNLAGGMSLLDHALNSMLMLSFVALRQGDSVGLICFSDQIHSFVPPRGGMNQMNHLLHASFDRFPQLVESRYDQAFYYLASHCRKRSLVVLISNVIDEVNALAIQQQLGTLTGKHLPLGVLLRDRRMFEAVREPAAQGPQLYRAAAAAQILSWRDQVLTDLARQGVLSLDVFPEEMTAPLVNQYLEIKARHLL